MAKTDALIAKIDAEIAELQKMRDYIVANREPDNVAEKKSRKPRKKRGMPDVQASEPLKF